MRKRKEKAPPLRDDASYSASMRSDGNTAGSQHQVSAGSLIRQVFSPVAIKVACRDNRRLPTDEELEVADALYKADLLRLTLAGKHVLKGHKAALLVGALDEAMGRGQS